MQRIALPVDESLRLRPIDFVRIGNAHEARVGTVTPTPLPQRAATEIPRPHPDTRPHRVEGRVGEIPRQEGQDRQWPATPPEPSTTNATRDPRLKPLLSEMPAAIFESLVEMWTGILCADYMVRHPEHPALDATDAARLPVNHDTDVATHAARLHDA